jgi:hypothetical protein
MLGSSHKYFACFYFNINRKSTEPKKKQKSIHNRRRK